MSTNSRKRKETLYVCKIVILRVTDVPVADLHTLSCDPYIQARLSVEDTDGSRDGNPRYITYRTHTCRRTLNPEFNASWIVSGIPESGFLLSLNLRDEDPHNYDDDLGKTVLQLPWPDEPDPRLHEGWKSGEREYKVHKRKGTINSRVFTCIAQVLTRGSIGHHVRLWITAEVLGKAESQEDRRLYTVGPRKSHGSSIHKEQINDPCTGRYVRHFSPLIGRFLGSSNSPDDDPGSGANPESARKTKVKPTAFVANRIQLAGPVPEALRHRYVGFAPFVKAMFRRSGIRGLVLHHTLHKQHMTIYRWDANTVWGFIEESSAQGEKSALIEENGITEEKRVVGEVKKGTELPADSIAFAKQFLRMTCSGTHNRIFTYVIMLDGEMRFTVREIHARITIKRTCCSNAFFISVQLGDRRAARDRVPQQTHDAFRCGGRDRVQRRVLRAAAAPAPSRSQTQHIYRHHQHQP
ncbi:hypothetical protein NM688_g7348 [Phlebia brevispora]|uniref:Uncharacterized protein n=1 Tax=Phlebia brevispora TaxID=194682 RepID=A0ACC1S6S4_9APHY|nr:hypothetical protein NM688_g7348 [Phlebia brevispora]